MNVRQHLKPALVMLIVLAFTTGIIYPLFVTAVAQVAFPRQADGSLLVQNSQVVGSKLMGQPFDDPSYFWSRPSATQPFPYNAAASSGSNLGPTSAELIEQVKSRVEALRATNPDTTTPVPVDLVTASASGLDPHISVAAAEYQVSRVARERDLNESTVRELVAEHIRGRFLGLFGEPGVNVLQLNLALDRLARTE